MKERRKPFFYFNTNELHNSKVTPTKEYVMRNKNKIK